jgi:hypothetical protein
MLLVACLFRWAGSVALVVSTEAVSHYIAVSFLALATLHHLRLRTLLGLLRMCGCGMVLDCDVRLSLRFGVVPLVPAMCAHASILSLCASLCNNRLFVPSK